LFDRVSAKIKHDAELADVTVNIAGASELPQVSGDAVQLTSALECVLRNAIEASAAGSTVSMHAELSGTKLVVHVVDAGCGISQEQRQHIFEPFYSGREAGRGLGMGLSKAWRIIQNHQGEIEIHSQPTGTRVSVILPALAAVSKDDTGRACA